MNKTERILQKTNQHHKRVVEHSLRLLHPTKAELRKLSNISIASGVGIICIGVPTIILSTKVGLGLIGVGAIQVVIAKTINLHATRS